MSKCHCKMYNDGKGWYYVPNGPDDIDKEVCECVTDEPTYTCDKCHKEVSDNGPFECSDGEYQCQECMERGEMSKEAMRDANNENCR